MSPNTLYAFTVVVFSKDNRTDSQTVFVTPSDGTSQLSIKSSFTRFNPSAKLVLDSTISADYPVDFTWSVFTVSGVPVNITSLTMKSILFPGSDELKAISFPFSVKGGIFSPGKAYTFQLSISSTDNTVNTTFSRITLTASSAPTSGYIVSSPTIGSALVTQFTVSSPGWTTDAASFPLSYAFSYELSSATPYLTIAASSLRASTVTTLPAGLLTQKYMLTLQTLVTDIYLSVSTANTPVRVTLAAKTNVSEILTTSLVSAFAIGDINLAIQTVNNVSLLCSSFLCFCP